jgi:hypothetical protein
MADDEKPAWELKHEACAINAPPTRAASAASARRSAKTTRSSACPPGLCRVRLLLRRNQRPEAGSAGAARRKSPGPGSRIG